VRKAFAEVEANDVVIGGGRWRILVAGRAEVCGRDFPGTFPWSTELVLELTLKAIARGKLRGKIVAAGFLI